MDAEKLQRLAATATRLADMTLDDRLALTLREIARDFEAMADRNEAPARAAGGAKALPVR